MIWPSIQNELESYAFQMKQTVEDDKVKDKISADEVKTICDACDEAIKWLDNNQTAEKVNNSLNKHPCLVKMFRYNLDF